MILSAAQIIEILQCPKCFSKLDTIQSCPNCGEFLRHSGQPVLINFDTSIVDRCTFEAQRGTSYKPRDDAANSFKTRLLRLLFGGNPTARHYLGDFLNMLKGRALRPRILVVGGGAIGEGAAELYTNIGTDIIGTDIYASPNTTFVSDGHSIPLADGSVDAVWIQAVLEHVLDPAKVVSEIHRVLCPNGLVFADTPFMQQVHEGAYDFTRFTLSGHRWLFRHFTLIDAGLVQGPGTAMLWAIRYFIRALIKNDKIATAIQMSFFWLRFADRLPVGRRGADATSGVFFFGRKAETSIFPNDMIAFYECQRTIRNRGIR
jgi:SAM-dependent methyltransferase